MSASLTKAMEGSRAFVNSTFDNTMRLKASGGFSNLLGSTSSIEGSFGSYREQAKNQESYTAFRNWLYSAIHAIAMEAASQPVNIARLSGVAQGPEEKSRPRGTKAHVLAKMPRSMRAKAAAQEYQVLLDHPLIDSIECPNAVQHRWQFVYSFAVDLLLTGWAYIVYSLDKDGKLEMWSLPTTWVRPNHEKGPFSAFYVTDPRKSLDASNQKPLTRDNVAFAYLPDPGNPLSALAPASSQVPAIRIDDYIQQSQQQFFQNGIFPSVVVTIGKDPHPDVPGGIRPRLTGAQRRQVQAAITKVMSGVANHGSPVIVDGLIESVNRFSMSEPEMGWAKSEDKVRTRILSSYGVHPLMLGEPLNVGGYSQSTTITGIFYKRVNAILDMLSTLMSEVAVSTGDESLAVWWEECVAVDPSLRQAALLTMRTSGDISQNEIRAEYHFPPDEDRNEAVITGGIGNQIAAALTLLAQGGLSSDQFEAYLIGLGLPTDLAQRIAGSGSDKQAVQQATEDLAKALAELKQPLQLEVGDCLEQLTCG